jgi:hypothetical protein
VLNDLCAHSTDTNNRLLYSIFKEYNLEIATGKTKIFGFVGTDHLRAKIIINNETLDQVT